MSASALKPCCLSQLYLLRELRAALMRKRTPCSGLSGTTRTVDNNPGRNSYSHLSWPASRSVQWNLYFWLGHDYNLCLCCWWLPWSMLQLGQGSGSSCIPDQSLDTKTTWSLCPWLMVWWWRKKRQQLALMACHPGFSSMIQVCSLVSPKMIVLHPNGNILI